MAWPRKEKRRFGGWLEQLEDRRVMSADPLAELLPDVEPHDVADPPMVEHTAAPVDDAPAFPHDLGDDLPPVDQHVLDEPDFWIDTSLQTGLDNYFGDVSQMLSQAHNLTGWYNVQNNYGFTGRGQTVAVIDTGIAWDHFALGGGFGQGYRVVGGWDFTQENDAVPYDDGPSGRHGTHVSGIIGSSSAANSGVAPGVDLVGLRVFNDAGQGFFSWIENALRWIHDNRNSFANPITAVNMSVGVSSWNAATVPNWANLEDELAQLKADGIFISVSAGNSYGSFNAPGLSYPASSQHVVPVMSVTDAGQISSFSQRLGRAIGAPGQGIVSTVPDYAGNKNGVADDFATMSGTSMAAPYVAGASTLIRQAMQFVGMTNITQDTIYNHMMSTADTFVDSATGLSLKRLNLGRAIDSLMPADDYGSTVGAAYNLGTLSGPTALNGQISKLTDVDCFTFTAGASGKMTFTATSTPGMTPSWQVAGATPLAGQPAGAVAFNVVAGQTYTVSLGTSSGMGNYTLGATLESTFVFTDWGAVSFNQVSDVSIAGERWYRVEATRTGALTVQGSFSAGSVSVALYDANQQLVANGATAGGIARVDANATAGSVYYLRVAGASSDIDFKLLNLVSQTGAAVTVVGTAGDDALSFTAGATFVVSINGVAYSFAAGAANQFTIDAGGGNDTLVINGSAEAETMTLRVGSATVVGTTYSLAATGAENQTAYSGGGADQAIMYDSAGVDAYDTWPDRVRMAGAGYLNMAYGFALTTGYSTAGLDRANFYDSAGFDLFETRAGRAMLKGAGFTNDSYGFSRTCAYSTTLDDKAVMYDSPGDETFVTYTDRAMMQGATFYHEARGFYRTTAFASQGNDRAGFVDTPGDEVFVAYADRAIFQNSYSYHEARGFDKTTAYASTGMDRAAFFDSAGDDVFVAYPDRAMLYGPGFNNEARGFKKVNATASTGWDRAVFFDSAGDDIFAAWSDKTVMYNNLYYNEARGFDRSTATCTAGDDRAVLYDSAGDDSVQAALWGAYMSGGAYYNEVRGFDRVIATKQQGGADTVIVDPGITDYLFSLVGAW